MNALTLLSRSRLAILLGLIPFALSVRSATCTAIVNGNWASGTTWSCGRAPQAGDTLIIPANRSLSVTTNITYTGAIMRVQVYGTLNFIGGGAKFTFPCGSIFEIMGPSGLITGNSSGNSQTIRICSVTVWSVGANPTMTGYTAWPTNSTLPVELISFTASANGGAVALDWSTATESNSDRFELQRSRDAVSFEPVAAVPAMGHSVELVDYAVTDAPPSSGSWYYRLLQFDTDGTVNDLGIRSALVEVVDVPLCFPVPANDHLVVHTTDLPGLLSVLDAGGREVMRSMLTVERNMLEVSGLRNGTYLVRVTSRSDARVQRVVIAH